MQRNKEKTPEILSAEQQYEGERAKAAEQEREHLRNSAAGYADLAKRMDALLNRAQGEKLIDFFEMNFLQQQILAFHEEFGGSTLFDILELVRFDTNYYTYHALNVALLNLTIGKLMGMANYHLERLVDAGMVLDVGMLLLPPKILKGGKDLNNFDRAMIKKHPEYTLHVLEKSGLADDPVLMDIVGSHHEHFNGTGYPRGLAGENIPLEARISAVADSFDAATARREYRSSKSPFAILQELKDNQDGRLDPTIASMAATGIAQMLVGRFVMLSDRSVGKVLAVHQDNLAYPEVLVVGRRVQTDKALYPLSLSGQMRMF